MPKQGLHLITPSAAVATGTGSSATINANGSVTFSTVTALRLEGVFSADYDNYQIVLRTSASLGDVYAIQFVSGSTINSSTNYVYQELDVTGTSIIGTRTSSATYANVGRVNNTLRTGNVIFLYGPYLSQPTVGRSLCVDSTSSARIFEYAFSHNVSSSYDGANFTFGLGTYTGLIAVYGMRK